MDNPKKMEGSVHRPFSININPDYVEYIERENASLQQEVERYEETLEHILEYWNKDRNDDAMFGALTHIMDVAAEALTQAQEGEE